MLPLLLGVESFVTLLDEPLEETIENTLGHGTDGVGDLVLVTALGDELVTDLDPWLQEAPDHVLGLDAQQLGDLLTFLELGNSLGYVVFFGAFRMYLFAVSLGLFFATPLLELHGTHVHDRGGDLVDVVLLFLGEAQYVEGLLQGKNVVKSGSSGDRPCVSCVNHEILTSDF